MAQVLATGRRVARTADGVIHLGGCVMYGRLPKIAALFPLVAIPLALVGCHHKPAAETELPEVEVSKPAERDYTEYGYYTGRLAAVETQDVKARVSAPIESVEFREGALVHRGDILYKLDPRTFQAQYNAAASNVKTTEAMLSSAVDEYTRVVNSGPGATPRDIAQAAERVNGLRAQLDKGKSDAELKYLDLDFTTIRADQDGIIGRTQMTRGNIVQPGQAGGTVLATIVSIDPIYAWFDVDSRTVQRVEDMIRHKKFVTDELRKLDPYYLAASTIGVLDAAWGPIKASMSLVPGRTFAVVPVWLELETESGFPHRGYIDFVDNQVNPSTGTRRVRGLFWNPERKLTPGYFVRVRVPLTPKASVLMVPDSAIVTDQDQKVLYVLNDENKVVYRPILLGGLQDGMRVIPEGLKATDRVIVNGLQRARPGAEVKPKTVDLSKKE
jgi:RND family efflux transporter MFP subunit